MPRPEDPKDELDQTFYGKGPSQIMMDRCRHYKIRGLKTIIYASPQMLTELSDYVDEARGLISQGNMSKTRICVIESNGQLNILRRIFEGMRFNEICLRNNVSMARMQEVIPYCFYNPKIISLQWAWCDHTDDKIVELFSYLQEHRRESQVHIYIEDEESIIKYRVVYNANLAGLKIDTLIVSPLLPFDEQVVRDILQNGCPHIAFEDDLPTDLLAYSEVNSNIELLKKSGYTGTIETEYSYESVSPEEDSYESPSSSDYEESESI